jgi:ADP-ribose pyrophosphatase
VSDADQAPSAGPTPPADGAVRGTDRRAGDPEPWVLVGERPAFDGFITVLVRRYRLPDGREVDWDVSGPALGKGVRAGIAVLPLTPDGRIVTVRMFRAGPDKVVTNLPGGLIDPGEDPATAGRRELEEETGYVCGSLDVVGWIWASSSSVYRKYVAIARDCRQDGRQSLGDYEDCVPVELTVDQFRHELRTPGTMTGTDAAYYALDQAGLL